MNIRNPEHFLNSMWDWSPFNHCFGDTKIRISDIDGVAERNGQILLIETKSHGATIPLGQKLLHKAFLATGVVTLLYVWGSPNETASQVKIHHPDGRTTIRQNVSPETLATYVTGWFEKANAIPRPHFA